MILNVYKPKGWTSFDVVAKLRGVLKTKKIGHAGTLDPLAEGVLVILTNEDTKKQTEFLSMDKEYLAEIVFGVDSPTYDMEGPLKLIDTYPSMAEVTAKIPDFVGNIEQAVPYYSAVKVAGKKLYNMARGGKEMPVDLPVKKVTIYGIEILDFSEKTVPFTDLGEQKLPVLTCLVNCSSGTYIRSLAHDLGGVLFNLRRTRVGDYIVQDSEDFLKMQPTN